MQVEEIKAYHAHLYYEDQAGRALAQQIAHQLSSLHEVVVGRFHERKVGPHPMWSVQIAFNAELFDKVIPWLMLNRGELDVLFHPLSGDELYDHTQGAAWLGKSHELDIRQFLPKI
ncbi:Dopa 4,5-dioxygenase family [Marinomonas aquimarina]|uniref:Dopa 4,5-dioxygenase family n=1 Tax=Marinomonas aquimarina TaxID=295068 RepID=A0A1A8T5V4_9GAMM|nr:DOPA 4,5-dioxygenase family protein [Marinomonas aquimarina]SBS26646.1 Dopa 4,5-dioxygenase family [Marinomonas aquimarina]